MSMMQEFKEFALKGNVMDMAVGIIIGASFKTIVSSLVDDVIMPPVGLAMGGMDFSKLSFPLATTTLDDGTLETVAINYGAFIQTSFDFLILAFIIFMMVKGINNLRKEEEAKPEEPAAEPVMPNDEKLLVEIRDLLKAKAAV